MLFQGSADHTVWYETHGRKSFATNLIIVTAKANWADACLAQLTAYMGIVHTYKKRQSAQDCVVYGAVSDGNAFRFLRIDNESGWTESRFLEWDMGRLGHDTKIYSILRLLIKLVAESAPSTFPIRDPQQRGRIHAVFSSPQSRKPEWDLSKLELIEEDSDTEIVGFGDSD